MPHGTLCCMGCRRSPQMRLLRPHCLPSSVALAQQAEHTAACIGGVESGRGGFQMGRVVTVPKVAIAFCTLWLAGCGISHPQTAAEFRVAVAGAQTATKDTFEVN